MKNEIKMFWMVGGKFFLAEEAACAAAEHEPAVSLARPVIEFRLSSDEFAAATIAETKMENTNIAWA